MEFKSVIYAGIITASLASTNSAYAEQKPYNKPSNYQDPVSSTLELFILAPAKIMERFANKTDPKYSKKQLEPEQNPSGKLESKTYQDNQNQRPKRFFRRR